MEEADPDEPDFDARRKQLVDHLRLKRAGFGDEGRREVGERPRPRTLVWIDDSDLRDQVVAADLFLTTRVLEGPPSNSVDDREWDLLITDQPLGKDSLPYHYEPDPRLHVVSFATRRPSGNLLAPSYFTIGLVERLPYVDGSVGDPVSVAWHGWQRATQFAIPGGLSSDLERLVESDLLPKAQEAEAVPVLGPNATDCVLRALLLTKLDDHVLATFLTRAGGKAEVLALPPGVDRPTDWITAAMRRWRSEHPATFAHLPDWRASRQWATSAEREALDALEALEHEEEQLFASLQSRRSKLESDLADARAAGEGGHRRLIEEASSTLVAGVADALREFGFSVEIRDEGTSPGRAMEDLRVTDPEEPDWTALVEVRAYTGGASPKDLMRLSRFAVEYTAEKSRRPDALWYVVNQFMGRDPASRPPVLHNEEPTLEAFVEEHGALVMDTADLFQIAMAVGEGQLDRAMGRRSLREATGRMTFSNINPERLAY